MASAGAGNFGDVFMSFYQNNGFTVGIFFVLLIGFFAVKTRREVFSKVCFWGVMLLALVYASEFFKMLYYFPSMNFTGAFDIVSIYAPSVCAVASITALIAQWDATDKKRLNAVAAVCAIIAIFMAVYYSARMLVFDESFGSPQMMQIFAGITGVIAMTMVSVIVYTATITRRTFDTVVYAMTNDEAELVESVEDKVETVVGQFEEEILENMASEIKKENSNADDGAAAEGKDSSVEVSGTESENVVEQDGAHKDGGGDKD